MGTGSLRNGFVLARVDLTIGAGQLRNGFVLARVDRHPAESFIKFRSLKQSDDENESASNSESNTDFSLGDQQRLGLEVPALVSPNTSPVQSETEEISPSEEASSSKDSEDKLVVDINDAILKCDAVTPSVSLGPVTMYPSTIKALSKEEILVKLDKKDIRGALHALVTTVGGKETSVEEKSIAVEAMVVEPEMWARMTRYWSLYIRKPR